jgi:hypothetical protein
MVKAIGAACARGVGAFVRKLPDLLRDLAALAGVAAIGYGAWLIYEPAGYIVSGALLIVVAVLTSLGRKSTG